jgi:hypothetical protein
MPALWTLSLTFVNDERQRHARGTLEGMKLVSLLATGLLVGCAASTPKPTPTTPTTPPPQVDAPIANVAEEPPPEVVTPPPPPTFDGPPQKGDVFQVMELAPDDAYYSSKADYIGLVCTASEAFQDNGERFYGGPAMCNNGEDAYFFRVRVAAAGSTVTADPTSYGPLARGTAFTITGIDATDAYHDDAAKIVGLSCTASDEMHERSEAPGWYGGPADCSDGQNYYFYSASISISGASGTKVSGTGVMGVTGGSTTGGSTTTDPDRDYDGIADSRDSCPDAAEDRDMDKDYDGCPDY